MCKFNAVNGRLASKKTTIAIHIKDMFEANETRKEACHEK